MRAQTNNDPFEVLTPIAVAREFNVYRETVRYWVQRGWLVPCRTVDGRNFFLRKHVEEFRAKYTRYGRRAS